MYDDTITLGVAVFLPFCSFEVEISRDSVADSVKEIDSYMDTCGVSKEIDERISEIINISASLSMEMAHGTVDAETATSELAYNFVYAFAKKHFDVIPTMRGIIGIVKNDHLYIEGYKDQETYKDCTDTLKSMSDSKDEEYQNVKNLTPTRTIH